MQKVVYLVSKVNKDKKMKGVGYLVEGNLLIPSISNKGNPYIRIFDDVISKNNKQKDTAQRRVLMLKFIILFV